MCVLESDSVEVTRNSQRRSPPKVSPFLSPVKEDKGLSVGRYRSWVGCESDDWARSPQVARTWNRGGLAENVVQVRVRGAPGSLSLENQKFYDLTTWVPGPTLDP